MAAAQTYEPIATVTASGGSNTQLVMSSIPSTYTDLILIIQTSNTLSSNMGLKFNSAGGTAYSNTWLNGSGTAVVSSGDTNSAYINLDGASYPTSGTTTIYKIHIKNYANTSVYKTIISRASNGSRGVDLTIGLWQSTAAINRIDFISANAGGTITSGSTLTLYGIKAA